MIAPYPRDMGPNGSQFERHYNGDLSPAEMGSGAGSFAAMCGLDARLNLSVNFTGARPAGNECDCDFRAEAGEINGYPNRLNAEGRTNRGASARATRPSRHARGQTNATQRAPSRAEAARLEARPETAGSANRSMPGTSVQWIAFLLGGFCLSGTGLALRRLRMHHS